MGWGSPGSPLAPHPPSPGVTGFLKIDENGDRESDYSLWDMDPVRGDFQVSPGTGAAGPVGQLGASSHPCLAPPSPRSWPTTTAPPRRSRWCRGVRSTGRGMWSPLMSPPVASITATHCAAKVSGVTGGDTQHGTPTTGTHQPLTALLSLCSQPVHPGDPVPCGQPDPLGHHHHLLLHLQVEVPQQGRLTLRLR